MGPNLRHGLRLGEIKQKKQLGFVGWPGPHIPAARYQIGPGTTLGRTFQACKVTTKILEGPEPLLAIIPLLIDFLVNDDPEIIKNIVLEEK